MSRCAFVTRHAETDALSGGHIEKLRESIDFIAQYCLGIAEGIANVNRLKWTDKGVVAYVSKRLLADHTDFKRDVAGAGSATYVQTLKLYKSAVWMYAACMASVACKISAIEPHRSDCCRGVLTEMTEDFVELFLSREDAARESLRSVIDGNCGVDVDLVEMCFWQRVMTIPNRGRDPCT